VVKKRGNSWWVVVYTGRDPLTGKKRQRPARPRPEPRPASSKPASSGKRGPLPAPTRAAGARASDRLPARPPDVTQCRPGRPCRPGRCLQAGPGVGLDRPQSQDAGHPAGGQAGQTSDHPRSARPSGGKITSLPGELRDKEWTKTRSKRRVLPAQGADRGDAGGAAGRVAWAGHQTADRALRRVAGSAGQVAGASQDRPGCAPRCAASSSSPPRLPSCGPSWNGWWLGSRRGCWSCPGWADQRRPGPGELVTCWPVALGGRPSRRWRVPTRSRPPRAR
jgi:hypothetical protein